MEPDYSRIVSLSVENDCIDFDSVHASKVENAIYNLVSFYALFDVHCLHNSDLLSTTAISYTTSI